MSVSFEKQYVPAAPFDARRAVLRNTYWLLALSMIPTVLGALAGVMFQIPLPRGFLGFFAFIAIVWGFMAAIEKTKNSAAGIFVLLGFTFFMGIWLTPLLTRTLGFSNGGTLIMIAFGSTGTILAAMATIATVSKRDFSMMGKWLFAGVLGCIVASFAGLLFELPALLMAVSALAVVIFSLYILYDVQQVINGGETNYISAAAKLYLDVYMVFSHLLSLLGLGGSRD